MKKFLAIAVAIAIGALDLSGCASEPQTATASKGAKDAEAEVVTGSRIPRKATTY
jgi:PBP1b-binding outer membrane lipoprotein LpoB